MSEPTTGLGIDIGGSGIKGAPVDLDSGEFLRDRLKILTPEEAGPQVIADIVAQIVDHFPEAAGAPVGITFPGVVQGGTVHTAANLHGAWVGTDARALFGEAVGRPVRVLNDADAAALAETRYGAAEGVGGTVLLTTLGTGIGTALVVDGRLVPNTEFGHLEIDGHDAETRASSGAKERDGLSYHEWAKKRLTRYYRTIEDLVWPDLIVVGGGVSRKSDKFLPLLEIRTPIVPARLRNTAGIVGAALAATQDLA
ncbi:polyphosphate--glucose phosphotransferase [Nocardiopsis sp. MG754419]|uniref:polyphosphate--glucose phosphotransferase n=1 Tax=Nocardiopsis sp. MG754419 TaxID=2259865 RepID=UPI001BA6B2BF|nr:ROK family protein [Nocardiopsis sp. MG754419]MBR8742155.1 ROK family protein [Nocardiopsis sp. MG754419]